MEHKWLEWSKQLQAIAQSGLTYCKDPYDKERYEQLRDISVDILASYTGISHEKIKLTFASDTGYATPKVDVRAVIFHKDQILLVREKSDNAWALPGGWADIGYSPAEVAMKEVQEEAGLLVEPIKLLAVLDKKCHQHPPDPFHVYKIFIHCAIIGGELTGGLETSEVAFFSEHSLPELSQSRNTKSQIISMFEYLKDPNKAVLFD
ncbi:NUDIX hydrolase [Paenibacillus sp. GXUN7292]|uniref:NUDIX hydrolase n=1 Tax=Paenibacillus sp. GXUN7292 TaxID=3422499 RepID=UPI003D7E6612